MVREIGYQDNFKSCILNGAGTERELQAVHAGDGRRQCLNITLSNAWCSAACHNPQLAEGKLQCKAKEVGREKWKR